MGYLCLTIEINEISDETLGLVLSYYEKRNAPPFCINQLGWLRNSILNTIADFSAKMAIAGQT